MLRLLATNRRRLLDGCSSRPHLVVAAALRESAREHAVHADQDDARKKEYKSEQDESDSDRNGLLDSSVNTGDEEKKEAKHKEQRTR